MKISFQQKLIVFVSIVIVTMGLKHHAAEHNTLFLQTKDDAGSDVQLKNPLQV